MLGTNHAPEWLIIFLVWIQTRFMFYRQGQTILSHTITLARWVQPTKTFSFTWTKPVVPRWIRISRHRAQQSSIRDRKIRSRQAEPCEQQVRIRARIIWPIDRIRQSLQWVACPTERQTCWRIQQSQPTPTLIKTSMRTRRLTPPFRYSSIAVQLWQAINSEGPFQIRRPSCVLGWLSRECRMMAPRALRVDTVGILARLTWV